jgi:spermidine/putrescine transport system substrate-binding protein
MTPFLRTTMLALAASTTLPCLAVAETIVVSNWANYMPPDIIERFTKETGIDIQLQVHATNDEIMGKVAATNGKGYDVLFISQTYVEIMRELGYLAELDYSQLPNAKGFYPEVYNLTYDPGLKYSAPYTWGTTGICYRSDLVAAPTSWMDLLNPVDAVKGKYTLLSDERWLLMAGEKALGLSVNETDPEKLAPVKDLLVSAKKNMLAFDSSTFFSRLISGEAVMVQAWGGWCNYGTAENDKIKYVEPKEGVDTWVDSMVVLQSSEHKEAAEKFINFVLQPENLKWTVENILFQVPNKDVMDSLSPDLLAKYGPLQPNPAAMAANEQVHDVGAAQKVISRLVSEIKAAQ